MQSNHFDAILTHIDQFFIRHQQRLERLTAIAITLPGIIDTENGIVHRGIAHENQRDAAGRRAGKPHRCAGLHSA